MSRPSSKHSRIEEWLLEGNSITQQVAIERFDCYRLSSVIHRLRKKHPIRDKEPKTANGRTTYSEYYIEGLQ